MIAWRDPDHLGRLGHDATRDLRPEDEESESTSVLTARAEVSLVTVSSEVWCRHPKGLLEVVTGDPISDGFFDVGAASRARAALGIDTSSDRPLLTVVVHRARGAAWQWAEAVTALRSEYEVALYICESSRLDPAWVFPRCWRGPGLYVADSDLGLRLADLMAASAAVIGEPSSRTRLAQELGIPTVGISDGGRELRRAPDAMATDPLLPAVIEMGCEDPDHLGSTLREAVAASGHVQSARELHRNAAARLADRLCAALQLLAS